MADRDYDDGYGAQQVAKDLIIVFSDHTKMWRHEYDGSEHWRYIHPVKLPKTQLPIKHLFADEVNRTGWASLKDLNL